MKVIIKVVLGISLLFSASLAFSQTVKPIPQTFVIKGSVKNFKDSLWRFFYPGFFKNQMIEVSVAVDGTFSKTIGITNPCDIGLYLGDASLKLFTVPGDTLILTWDNQNFKNSFNVKANSRIRQQEIDMMIDLAQYREPMMELVKKDRNLPVPDSVKLSQVNNFFVQQIQTVLKYPPTENQQKILYDQYFEDKSLLKALGLKNTEYKPTLNNALTDSLSIHGISKLSAIESALNEPLFLKSYQYRDAITEKLRKVAPFNSYLYNGPHQFDSEPNYTLKACYAGMAFLHESPLILDWYLARTIYSGYGNYKFELVEQAYIQFSPQIKTPAFKQELTAYHDNLVRTLKPGVPAPLFKLKDANGKLVSLSDFKGKTVYIDFWGVNCAPCLYDIKNYSASVHNKYRDKDVVFLNICVDAINAVWKKSLGDLHMQGTNVIAEGWAANPVCKAYNVTGIPHYILVDAKGNIADNNAPRMEALQREKNGLDNLLLLQQTAR